jgi:hypothetical protein
MLNHICSYNLQVDSLFTLGFASNRNMYKNINASSVRIKFGNAGTYNTLADFTAATGHDANSVETDPLFADAFGGDFTPLLTPTASPLIDTADSSVTGWSSKDALGNDRVDQPCCIGGTGTQDYSDKGAIEAKQ